MREQNVRTEPRHFSASGVLNPSFHGILCPD